MNGKTAASSAAGRTSNQPHLSSAAAKPSSNATPEERKRQMAQLAEMGVASPEEYRREMAMVSEWQAISTKPNYDAPDVVRGDEDGLNEEESPKGSGLGEPSVRAGKRRHEDDPEECETAGRRKVWGSSTKAYPGCLDVGDDLDALLASAMPRVTTYVPDAPAIEPTDSAPDHVKREISQDPLPTSKEGKSPKPSIVIVPNESKDHKAAVTEQIESTEEVVVMFKRRKQKAVEPS